jgi:hypothetical protein
LPSVLDDAGFLSSVTDGVETAGDVGEEAAVDATLSGEVGVEGRLPSHTASAMTAAVATA